MSMDLERKRVASNASRNNGVVVGSVWESRMRGSFKVFNGDNQETDRIETNNQITQMEEKVKHNEVMNGGGKRKTWKSETNSGETEGNTVQITKSRSENKKELTEMSEIKKSPPIQIKKGRPEWNSSSSRTIKTRSLSIKETTTSNGIEKTKSLPAKTGLISDESNLAIQDIESDEFDDKLIKDANTMEEKVENEERAIVVVQQMEQPISTIKKQVVIEDNKIHHKSEKSSSIPTTIRKEPPPVVNHPKIISKPNERAPKSHNKLQTFIDLIMWRDASKSSLVFGLGTFSILSSSYTQDLNISLISVISYLGLIYLAAIFIFRSFILRGVVEKDDENEEYVVVGEEEAIWALKIFLPYINEFLLKVKALFSGDPSTTMKLAVLLFILARCGSSITIWKMAKLGFLAVFTVPKICSSYSSQLTAYGTFWVGRFKDAWESCSQKKAVALGVFTLVWNLSSIVARIWAVFMLLVAFKYYQQSMMKDDVVLEEEPISRKNQSSWQEQRNSKTGSTKLKNDLISSRTTNCETLMIKKPVE